MHNSRRLVKGPQRCTLLVHPDDARSRHLADGDRARLESEAGTIDVPVEVTDAMLPGVVSLPHGWGHDREGTRLGVAREHAGASVNDVTSDLHLDTLSGNAAFNGLAVTLRGSALRPAGCLRCSVLGCFGAWCLGWARALVLGARCFGAGILACWHSCSTQHLKH